jgi:hypothetical protein
MRIVVSTLDFSGFAGTETYSLTIARQFSRLGHDPMIYSPRLGPMADHAREHGLRVIGRLEALPGECDAVLAQDGATAYDLAERYPSAARAFVIHSRFPVQTPPALADVSQAVVVMNDRLAQWAQRRGLPRVVRLRQPVDLMRFRGWRTAPRRPLRVLSLSNYPQGARERIIDQACAANHYVSVHRGTETKPTATPEFDMASADIVISLGRGAVEGMAAGRAVYVLGPVGGDGWVTPESYPALERDGFSGRATASVIDLSQLSADLAVWNEELGELGRDLAWAHHDAEHHAAELIDLLSSLGASHPPPSVAAELARLIRMEWHEFARAQSSQADNERLRAEVDKSALRLAELVSQLSQTEERLQDREALLRRADEQLVALLATRRFRLISGLARPVDELRELWRGLRRR